MTDQEKKQYEEQIDENSTKGINDTSLWNKMSKYAQKMGLKAVYTVLLLYYAFKRKETPAWAKRVVTGVIAYFIMPIDVIPDLTPFLGFTDDIGLLSFALVTISAYVNKDVKEQSRGTLNKWFDNYDEEELEAVDKQLD